MPGGRLEAILGKGDSNWRDGLQESLILVLLDALAAEAATDLLAALSRVLDDVRAAVDDWPRMLSRLDEAIVALEPRAAGDDLVAETVAFGRWLRAGQFTLPGHARVPACWRGRSATLAESRPPGSACCAIPPSTSCAAAWSSRP